MKLAENGSLTWEQNNEFSLCFYQQWTGKEGGWPVKIFGLNIDHMGVQLTLLGAGFRFRWASLRIKKRDRRITTQCGLPHA